MPLEMLHLDSARYTASIGDHAVRLPYKTWRVLIMLIDAGPHTVSRATLIEQIWAGNYLTGEKGLNQAIWSIRRALRDDARAPTFLRTVPREGYRWLGGEVAAPMPSSSPRPASMGGNLRMGLAAGILLMLSATAADVWHPESNVTAPATTDFASARLWREGGRMIVDTAEGCRRIFKTVKGKHFGASALSDDGQRIVFELINARNCRMVEFDLVSNERRDLAGCLSDKHG